MKRIIRVTHIGKRNERCLESPSRSVGHCCGIASPTQDANDREDDRAVFGIAIERRRGAGATRAAFWRELVAVQRNSGRLPRVLATSRTCLSPPGAGTTAPVLEG